MKRPPGPDDDRAVLLAGSRDDCGAIDLADRTLSDRNDGATPADGRSAPSRVFVSYSREDAGYVAQLVTHLAEHGVSVWVDRSGIGYGSRWRALIRTAIETCATVVVIMTPEAETSEWVEREIAYAELLDKPIMPLLLRGTIMFSLAHLHYEDVRGVGMPGDEWVEQLVRLSRAGD